MSHTPHELAEEFPELAAQMAQLRQTDNHFAKLSEQYHTINRDVHRAETNVEPTSDAHMIEIRRARLALKDEIYSYLKAQKTG